MIRFSHKGDFSKTKLTLEKMKGVAKRGFLDKYGKEGVAALASATPVDTGLTASSWEYKVEYNDRGAILSFHNTNFQNGVPIAIVIQYGHGTRNGGWVEGRDYINPAIQPVFDRLVNEAWGEVTRL